MKNITRENAINGACVKGKMRAKPFVGGENGERGSRGRPS